MADTREGGIPWWVWLLVAIVVIAIIWWLVGRGDDTAAPAEDPTVNEMVIQEDEANDVEAVTPFENAQDALDNAQEAIDEAQDEVAQ